MDYDFHSSSCLYHLTYRTIEVGHFMYKYRPIGFLVDNLFDYYSHTIKTVYRIREEPVDKSWTNVSHITGTENCIFYELYVPASTLLLLNGPMERNKTTIYIDKEGPNDYTYRMSPFVETPLNDSSLLGSFSNTTPKKFSLIEYSHDLLNTPVSIVLPNHIYKNGNEILSAAFVLRHLEYTYGSMHNFHMDYTITLVDADINIVYLKDNQYVKFVDGVYYVLTC